LIRRSIDAMAPIAPPEKSVAVKTEEAEAEEADDANKTVDDLPDFGSDDEDAEGGTKVEVLRQMPDYGDLIDDDAGGPVAAPMMKKEEQEESQAEARPEAIVVTGVQRLTRTHLAEIFASKKLPNFQRLEWIADDQVVCVFEKPEVARKALDGALGGFDSAEERPGPGLWRASRGMLDFKAATVAHVPGNDFKKRHRGGRQVRDFRFWEAAKDIDKDIMDNLEAEGSLKRPLPSGEDAIAAAVPGAKLEAQPPRKKRRKAVPDVEEEAPDLLQQMASQDKQLMALKEEEEDKEKDKEPTAELEVKNALPDVSDAIAQEKWEDSWFSKPAEGGEDAWGRHAKEKHDDSNTRRDDRPDRDRRRGRDDRGRDTEPRDWRHDKFQDRNWPPSDRGRDALPREREDRERRRSRSRGAQRYADRSGGTRDRGEPAWAQVDDDEKNRRQKRMSRFNRTAPAAATDTAGEDLRGAASV